MIFDPPLVRATLLRRYKRFLADCVLEDGTQITASVPNTGSMAGLTTPGSTVWLSVANDPKRKYVHRLELVEADGICVGINTAMPNKLALEAIAAGMIDNLQNYETLKTEQRYGQNSRIDILLNDNDLGTCYVEVKNVHFMRKRGRAEFPDSQTSRGAKHLVELSEMVRQGHRAIMVYLVQRDDCNTFSLCKDLDPFYADAFASAMKAGVEACCIRCHITPNSITALGQIPIDEPLVRLGDTKEE